MKRKGISFKRIAISLFVVYAAITLANQQMTIARLQKTEQEVVARIQKADRENEKLKAMIDNAATPEYVERMAREQLGLVKAGERVYIDQAADGSEPENQSGDTGQ